MQRDFVIQQLKEEAQKVEKNIAQLLQDEQLTQAQAEQFLSDVEKLYRNLSVYAHVLKTQGNLQVHLKIMQSVPLVKEPLVTIPTVPATPEKVVEPIPEINFEVKEEKKEEPAPAVIPQTPSSLKKIEFSINDKFRIINELFFQSQKEFDTAIQQLNSINTFDESLFYLGSLKQIYTWKDDNQLVKTLYSVVNKRFL